MAQHPAQAERYLPLDACTVGDALLLARLARRAYREAQRARRRSDFQPAPGHSHADDLRASDAWRALAWLLEPLDIKVAEFVRDPEDAVYRYNRRFERAAR